MTPRLPILKPRKVITVLERNGFRRIKKSSGHARFKHPDGRWAEVPVHGKFDIAKGVLNRILESSEKQIDEFL